VNPPVVGLLESALYVSNLDRSAEFYGRIFGFPVMFSEGDRMRALNVAGRQVLLLFRIGGSTQPTQGSGGTIPPHDGSGNLHFAFAIGEDQLERWRAWLSHNGVPIESEVKCGGTSLYFRDPDGHLVELITPGCWPVY
jgi:catechol 2,3-dioxygenase-like lactoylglutathione lyase family enzyme